MQTREKNFLPAGQKAHLATAGNVNIAAPQQARWYVTGVRVSFSATWRDIAG